MKAWRKWSGIALLALGLLPMAKAELTDLTGGTSSANHGEVENISLSPDGSTASDCRDADDQCAFRDSKHAIAFSSLSPGKEPKRPGSLVLSPFEESATACEDLDWAGNTEWRLPSFREAVHLKQLITRQVERFPGLGGNNVFIWLNGFKYVDGQNAAHYAKEKSWVAHLSADRWLHLPKTTRASYRCIQSDADKLWEDVSLDAGDSSPAECNRPGVYCAFRHRKSQVVFTEPKTHLYRRENRGVTYAEAEKFCDQQDTDKYMGRIGWRLPNYEEGIQAGRALYYSYVLSRDGVAETLNGAFWVTPPASSDEPAINCGHNSTLRFSGYACDFRVAKCARVHQCVNNYRGPYQEEPRYPTAYVFCATDGKRVPKPVQQQQTVQGHQGQGVVVEQGWYPSDGSTYRGYPSYPSSGSRSYPQPPPSSGGRGWRRGR